MNLSASGKAGPLKRPISLLSFSGNIYFTGLDPFPFKLTNLIIHLINGVLVFFLGKALMSQLKAVPSPDRLGLLIAGIFLLHPLVFTGALYIVQRMTSLSALFTLAGLLVYTLGRQQSSQGRGIAFVLVALFVFTALGALSKENGLLLPYFCLLIEIFFFQLTGAGKFQRGLLKSVYFLIVAVPVIYLSYKTLNQPGWLADSYGARPFSLVERILTEFRVIWFYLRLIFIPDITAMGVFHDDIPLSKSLLIPQITVYAFSATLALLIAAISLFRKAPMFSFGVLFFFIGHSMESSIFALDIAHEHRNYLPILGPIISVVYYASLLLSRFSLKYKYAASILVLVALGYGTSLRAYDWGDNGRLALAEARNHPGSILANHEAGRVYIGRVLDEDYVDKKSARKKALGHFLKSYELDITNANSLLTYIHASYLVDNPVLDSWYQQLYVLLSTTPLTATTYSEISSFTKCVIQGFCMASREQMGKIYQATMTNPFATGEWKGPVLISASRYFASQREYIESIRYIYAAVKLNDDFENRYYLVNSLLNYGYIQQAVKELNVLKNKSYVVFYKNKIDGLDRGIKKKISRFSPSNRGKKGEY